ncbi:hypothetical protein, partial [Hymenobacter agri]
AQGAAHAARGTPRRSSQAHHESHPGEQNSSGVSNEGYCRQSCLKPQNHYPDGRQKNDHSGDQTPHGEPEKGNTEKSAC